MSSTHTDKGRVIEDLVHRLHEVTGFVVRSRVRLPSRRNPQRRREVDVLVTGEMLGRAMHLAFECKNYGSPTGVPIVAQGYVRVVQEDHMRSMYVFSRSLIAVQHLVNRYERLSRRPDHSGN